MINSKNNNKGKFINSNITILYFKYETFNSDILGENLSSYLKSGVKYSFLIKVKKVDDDFGMAGNQVKFEFYCFNYNEQIKKLYIKLNQNLNIFRRKYVGIEIIHIQLLFITVRSFPELELKNINRVKLNKDELNIGKTKRDFNSLVLPLTLDENYYGIKLKYNIDDKGKVESVFFNNINFIDYIKDNSEILNKYNNDFYVVNFYLYLNKLNEKYVIVSMSNAKERFSVKEVFDLSGILVLVAYDSVINGNEFNRSIGPTTLLIKGSNVNQITVKYLLPYIKNKYSSDRAATNDNIGTFDIETYKHTRNEDSYIYALGYKINKGVEKKFYLSENESNANLVLNCINSMLINDYHGCKFYVHNLGGFDAVFVYKVLDEYNLHHNNYYVLDPIFRDNRIIKLDVKVRKNLSDRKQPKVTVRKQPGFIKITLIDSYSLLPEKLKVLADDFECDVKKGIFPYEFVNELTLNYVGNTPDKDYFEKVDEETKRKEKISDKEYNIIKKLD